MKTILIKMLLLVVVMSVALSSFASCEQLEELGIKLPDDSDKTSQDGEDKAECEHTVDKWYFAGGESCENGTFFGYCLKCSEVVSRQSTDEDEHDWGEGTTVLPSCEKGGYDVRVCSACEKSEKYNFTQKYGHFISSYVHEATCTTDGYVLLVCNVCDYEERVAGAPAAHSYPDEYISTDEGHYRKCTKCTYTTELKPHAIDSNGICVICKNYFGTAEVYDVTIWVSEMTGVAQLFAAQIAAFEAANPGIKINASIEGVTEADAGSRVVADVASAPDIFCFAQDQLARLVQSSALAPVPESISAAVKADNDKASVAAATLGDKLYAYPITSDNGYYLYYDKSIISNPDSLEDIIKACEDNGVKFRFALENAWYTASFFFATGCHSNWTTNSDGEFVSVDDNFNSLEGMIAMKGMQKLAQSTCYDSYTDIFIDAFADAGAIVTGIWNAGLAREHFGDNLGAADLPSFTVDGKSYHLGSYSGHKLIGVKPQSDAKKAEVLALLAQYLTGTECQMERYNEFNLTPSNIDAQNSDVFKADVHSSALVAQNEYATPQGNIAAVYWDTAKLLGAVAKNATNDVDLQMGLDDYKEAVDDFVKFTPEQRNSYTVIGDVNGTMWDTDFEMVKGEDGSWVSKDVFDLAVGDEFKVRFGMDWKVAYGNNEDNANTSIGLNSKGNYIVETAGRYYIKIVVNEDTTAVITLVPAE